jgi:acetyl-CoA/propionyl-CoA carboxylase biotin carboxyl carrier protein
VLGDRDCSLQRRNQKVIEEAPAPGLPPSVRRRLHEAARELAASVGYRSAGTVEFVYDPQRQEASFLEVNARLQVEHPVTEQVYRIDLVEQMLRLAGQGAGGVAEFMAARHAPRGHAVEARVYAEDPARRFLPTGGTVLALHEPAAPCGRVDSGLATGMTVTSSYDPMLAKIIAWGPNRGSALRRLDAALAETAVLGVTTNIAFLRALLGRPDVATGRLDTGLIERHLEQLTAADVPDEVLAAAALATLLAREPAGPVTDPWDIPDGWRLGEAAWTRLRLACASRDAAEVRIRGHAPVAAEVSVGDADPVPARAELADGALAVTYGGRTRRLAAAHPPRSMVAARQLTASV